MWTLDDLASTAETHLPDAMYAAPMVTNWWAEAQACRDPVAYRFFSAPPLATAEGIHAELYLRLPEEDRIVPLSALGAPITYQWFPDAVTRHMTFRGLRFSSRLCLAADRDVLLLYTTITNVGASRQD